MPIETMTITHWQHNKLIEKDIENPAWIDVENAIKELQGDIPMDIFLHPDKNDNETWLAISGEKCKCLVTGSIECYQFPTLIDPTKSADEITYIIVGGQEGDYQSNMIVNIDMALQAAKYYFETGQFDERLQWLMQ